MIIKVDIRETALIQQIHNKIVNIPMYKNIQFKSETLPIGDIILCDENEEYVILERKTLNDLLSSVKDGRYEEQSYRLNGSEHPNHNIIYLIEGDVHQLKNIKKERIVADKSLLYSAMFSLNYYKGFSVFRSFTLEESATIICNMAYKIEKDKYKKKPFYKNQSLNVHNDTKIITDNMDDISGNINETCVTNDVIYNINGTNKLNDKEYVNVIKKIKKDNITPNNIGEIMLCQIPGISSVSAIAIMKKYETISNLLKELEKDTNCLNGISYTNEKGQTRKINKNVISNIVHFLLKK